MMDVTFQPLFPLPLIALTGLAVLGLSAYGLALRLAGAWFRLVAGAALVLALLNPVLRQEERSPLSTIVPVLVDRSQSQQ